MLKRIRSSMAASIVMAIVVLLAVVSIVVSTIGTLAFTTSFNEEYATTTYHMADTAAARVYGDHIDLYLDGWFPAEYNKTKEFLDSYCRTMSVSLVYVIKVDTSDYGSFISIFNSVNNDVDNSSYTPWELGYQRDTTNEEYREKYQLLYGKKSRYETVYRTNPGNGIHPHITTMVPIFNAEEEVVSILCIQRPISELYAARKSYLRNIGISTILLAVAACYFAAVYFKKHFVVPVRKMSAEATRFAKENQKGDPLGNISRYREITALASSIDTMETDMVNYIENLTAITAERERISAELSVASTIQESSIPNIFPAFPDREDLDIYASMTPAKEVGGDFYNFFLIDEDHLGVMIGDVSGKGIAAALFMMVVNIMISDRLRIGGTPAEVLGAVNNTICERNEAEMFVTVWLGILELSTGKLTAANAGHEDACIYRKDGIFEICSTKHDLVIGALPGMKYHDFEEHLGNGDKLFLYTDGIPEATDKENRMFTLKKMLQALNRNKEKTPKGILEGVHDEVRAFVGDAPQFDDLTMLCIERK